MVDANVIGTDHGFQAFKRFVNDDRLRTLTTEEQFQAGGITAVAFVVHLVEQSVHESCWKEHLGSLFEAMRVDAEKILRDRQRRRETG
jgi:hypothetical protein